MDGWSLRVAAVTAVLIAGVSSVVSAKTGSFVAPLRTIADITAILDQEKPDPAKAAMRQTEALREAMMGLLDAEACTGDQGKMLFTYGHPLFWAPYSIMGDGGGGGP